MPRGKHRYDVLWQVSCDCAYKYKAAFSLMRLKFERGCVNARDGLKNLALSNAVDGVQTSDYVVDDNVGLCTSSTTCTGLRFKHGPVEGENAGFLSLRPSARSRGTACALGSSSGHQCPARCHPPDDQTTNAADHHVAWAPWWLTRTWLKCSEMLNISRLTAATS